MEVLLRVVLYGVLPSFALALLLVGWRGPRWLGVAAGIGVFAALALLRGRMPSWPHTLWQGNNDNLQWLVWCVLAAGGLSAAGGGRLPPRWLAVPLGAAALLGQPWLMLANRRARMGSAEVWLLHGAAALAFVGVWLATRRAIERRGGPLLAWLLTFCLVGDSAVLLLSGSALQGQLAGAVAAAFGTAAGTALWRRPFEPDRALALPFTAAHAGLLLAGNQFSELLPVPAVLAAAAPAALAFAGGKAEGGARLIGAVLAMAGLLGGAVAIVLANQP